MDYKKRFLPLLVTQFLGALNDNLFKNALIILITFGLAEQAGIDAQTYVIMAGAIFIAPFFLFSSTTGQLSDRYPKQIIMRTSKLLEIVIMCFALSGLILSNIYLLLFTLFLLGTQSTLFGPAKYAVLPELLSEKELVTGNGQINALTFLAILIGTLLGGILISLDNGKYFVGIFGIIIAIIGWLASRQIIELEAKSPEHVIDWNVPKTTVQLIKFTLTQKQQLPHVIIGISWFWFVGSSFLALLSPYTKDVLQGDQHVVTALLTSFAIGIGIGSILCTKLLNGLAHATFVPLSALGMAIFGIDLYFASNAYVAPLLAPGELINLGQFFSSFSTIRIFIDFMMIAICGGIYVVPLESILQERAAEKTRARLIAGGNIINALFMVLSALVLLALSLMGLSIAECFLVISIFGIIAAVYMCKVLPKRLIRSIFHVVLKAVYRVEVNGLEHLKKVGERSVIVANHSSFLDAILLVSFLPLPITFAMNTQIANKWWMRPVRSFANIYPIDPTNPYAIKNMIKEVNKGSHLVIFPEGRITVTGSLMKIYEGPGMISDKSGAPLLPVQINGAQYSPFSKLKGINHIKSFPKITLNIQPITQLNLDDDIKGRARRKKAGLALYKLMSKMNYKSLDINITLMNAIARARQIHGGKKHVLEDIQFNPINLNRLIRSILVLSQYLKRALKGDRYVGLLLPNSISTVVSLFALQKSSMTPAMLNFSSGVKSILSSCYSAQIKTVITSKLFIEKGNLEPIINAMIENNITIVYLEDVRDKLTIKDKFLGALNAQRLSTQPEKGERCCDPAVVLFTSGSEGAPKGVVLSHCNLLANCQQVASRVDFNASDKVFNVLPIFHSFALTGATILPLINGIKTFLYPSPLHYRIIPELIYGTDSTIVFGTDTFLNGYARYANPYDFYSVRYIFAGAEKLKPATRQVYADKYGVRVFEGYGATETSPALALNTPMFNEPGSVGQLLPGMDYKIEKVEGISDDVNEVGRLWVKGPNIMLGYLKEDQPGVLQPLESEWYDTGDIVSIKNDYIYLQGRAKRFAKIGGEMVSLGAIEEVLNKQWPDFSNAVINIDDERKGEKLIVITDNPLATREEMVATTRKAGLGEIMIPKQLTTMQALPLLGTGKIDYVSIKEWILEQQA